MRNLTIIGVAAACGLTWWLSRATKKKNVAASTTNNTNTNIGDNMRMPRGLANHNPLNIRENDRVDYDWLGESVIDNDADFEVFETPFYGIRAAARILKTYRDKRGLNTVEGIINRWAPTHENPTSQYAAFVAHRANVSEQQALSLADYPQVISAMIYFENGYNPYDETLINNATAEGLA